MGNKTLGEIEQTIFNDLVRLIKDQLDDFLNEVFDKSGDLGNLQRLINNYLEVEESLKPIKKELEESAREYKKINDNIKQSTSFSEIFGLGGYKDFYIKQNSGLQKPLKNFILYIKKYNTKKNIMKRILTRIVPYIV